MSKSGANYERYNGDDRCQVERATGLGYINEVEMDAEFNDFKGALNQVLWRDGSAALTGNMDFNGNNILNLNQVTGNVIFLGTPSFTNGFSASGGTATMSAGATVLNGFAAYGGTEIYGGLTVSGTVSMPSLIDNDTYTPTFEATGGTFAYTNQVGTYMVVGDHVICSIYLSANLSGTHTGLLGVTLPHTTASGTYGTAVSGQYSGIDGSPAISGRIDPGTNYINVQAGYDSLDKSASVSMNDVSTTVLIHMTAFYTKA